jgi:hypothetical protein
MCEISVIDSIIYYKSNEPITIKNVKKMNIPTNHIIEFIDYFNNKIDGSLIEGIKIIKLGLQYNKCVDNLPSTLEEIYFNTNFNQNIDNLPNNLKILYLGQNFNKSVDKLPANLDTLIIQSNSFNQNLNNLPTNLKNLLIFPPYDLLSNKIINSSKLMEYEIKNNFSTNKSQIEFNNILTISCKNSFFNDDVVKYIINILKKYIYNVSTLNDYNFQPNNFPLNNLPLGLKNLLLISKFNNSVDNLPNSLETLILGNYFNLSLDNLPNSLKILGFGKNFNSSLNNLPNSIKILSIGSKLSNKIEVFPKELKQIIFHNDYNHELSNLNQNTELYLTSKCLNIQIPNSHKKVSITNDLEMLNNIQYIIPDDIDDIKIYIGGYNTNKIGEWNYLKKLPSNLKTITFINSIFINCEENILKLLPRKLNKIIFSEDFNYNKKIEIGDLPDTLEVLYLPDKFNKTIDKTNLPNNLKELKIGYSYDKLITNLPTNLKKIILSKYYNYLYSFKLFNMFSKFKIISI